MEVEKMEEEDEEVDGNTVRSSTRDDTVRNDDSMQGGGPATTKRSKREDKEYVLELHLRKLRIHLVPQMNFFPSSNKMPFTVYVSRSATVGELQMKVA